jgi:hypothetical protein
LWDALQAKKEWQVVGEYPLRRSLLPASFATDEAEWVLSSLKPRIAQEAGAANDLSTDSGFGHLMSGLLWGRITHIVATEVAFPALLLRKLEPYGEAFVISINDEPVYMWPRELPEISVGTAQDFSRLDPSRAYVQVLTGTPFSALLFHVSAQDGRVSCNDAWWRFVFTTMPPQCPTGLAP